MQRTDYSGITKDYWKKIMITNLTHVGLTVKKMERSIQYYEKTLGLKVISDAPRKGDFIDKITGIPNFHSRTVYVAFTPYEHLELFEVYYPDTLPHKRQTLFKVGIPYCSFIKKGVVDMRNSKDSEKPYPRSTTINLYDPDGISLQVIDSDCQELKEMKPTCGNSRLLYPTLITQN